MQVAGVPELRIVIPKRSLGPVEEIKEESVVAGTGRKKKKKKRKRKVRAV